MTPDGPDSARAGQTLGEGRVAAEDLRVLQVNTRDRGGGAEGSAWNLFQGLARRGFDSWLAVGQKLSKNENVFELADKGRLSAWVQALEDRRSGTRPQRGLLFRKTRAGLRWMLEPRRFVSQRLLGFEDFGFPATYSLLQLPPREPSIVHLHNLHGGYFDLRALPELSRRVPVILNLRDEWLLTGHCAYSMGCDRWRTGCGHCPDLQRYPAVRRDTTAFNWRRKRRIFRSSRLYVTAPSRWLLERARLAFPTAADIRLITNAIDLNTFRPGDRAAARATLGLDEETWVVVFSAHSAFKDFGCVHDALQRLHADVPIVALCLGRDGATERVGEVELRFLGYVREPGSVAACIQASDVFVHATLGEAFGKGAAEAMACGIPVVASEVGGLPEVVRDGVDGILVAPGDAGAMASALDRLRTDASLRMALGANAVKRANEQFSLDRQVTEFVSWYREVLQDWRGWAATAR